MVLRVRGIDGDDKFVAPVLAAGDFVGIGIFGDGAGFGQHFLGKGGAQAVAMDHRDHVDAGITGPAEDFDHAATRGDVAISPVFQIDDDELARLGGGVADEVDFAFNRLVVAIDPAVLVFFAKNADEAAGAAGEDFLDLAADFIARVGSEFAAGAEWPRYWTDQGNAHAVTIQRGGDIAAVDENARVNSEVQARGEILRVGEVGEKEGVALWLKLERAGELVLRSTGEEVGGFLRLDQQAFLDQGIEGFAQFCDLGSGQFKAAGQLRLRKRVAAGGAQGIEDGISHIFANHA